MHFSCASSIFGISTSFILISLQLVVDQNSFQCAVIGAFVFITLCTVIITLRDNAFELLFELFLELLS